MVIKRYIGDTTQDAMTQVKLDLGSDAIILNTRFIRKKGIIHWFSKPLVEVTAAIDEDIESAPKAKKTVLDNKPQNHFAKDINDMDDKVDAVGEMIRNMIIEYGGNLKGQPKKSFGPMEEYFDRLIANEVSEENAIKIIERAEELQKKDNLEASRCVENAILEFLGEDGRPIDLSSGKKRTILFVGPTGVGKTTTLAKLAAGFAIEKGKKVGFITADTYRIAAVDQLRVYAEILGIPMSVIYSPGEIAEALEEHSDKDIILIDTPGRSIRDEVHEKEISEILGAGNIDEVYLVISANTGYQGCVNILNSYKFLGNYKLIFTKIDEITTYGVIINCKIKSQNSLSYMTTGQNVPVDIELVNIEKIKDLLMGNRIL